jgi:hypothetical protein
LKYNHIFIWLIFCSVLFLFPHPTAAKEYSSFGPFTVRNQNPFYLQTLNLTPTRAAVLPRGVLEVRFDSAYSNIFEHGNSASNSFMADMELWRLALNAQYAVTDDMEAGMEIPFIHTWGGFLDPFIEAFHRTFGFPNAGRETVPDNQFTFHFDAGGQRIYNVNSVRMGLGDITLHLKHHVLDEGRANPALAWFFDLKLPTGRRSRGLGGGNIDYGFGLALEKSYKRLHGYLNTAYYISGRDDVLEAYMNPAVFSFAAAIEITILPTWSFLAQVNSGTPLLAHTAMDAWDGVPLELIIGFKGAEPDLIYGNDLIWQFGFSEDATSGGPSVDFTVFLSVGMRFDLKGRKSVGGQKGNMILKRPELTF